MTGNDQCDDTIWNDTVHQKPQMIPHGLAFGFKWNRISVRFDFPFRNTDIEELHFSSDELLHGVYNRNKGHGVDECCIWGDYYYMESLVKLVLR